MNIRLDRLTLTCRSCIETVSFSDFSYFYGEMGAGKSTIARLIDYCFGSSALVMTPALQSEFISVALAVLVNEITLTLERERGATQLLASWQDQRVLIPARVAAGPVLPNTSVEVLSDLLFYLAGRTPPKVRRSQLKDESELQRLSFRDLLWYCYLDQDSMDSSFFHLDRDADNYKRLKSRNVLRSIVGIHQEKVAELEAKLEELRSTRQRYDEAAKVLAESLQEAGVSTVADIDSELESIESSKLAVAGQIAAARQGNAPLQSHVTDRLKTEARSVGSEIEAVDIAINELQETTADDRRHVNEIMALSTKVRRLDGARAVLNGVEFERCPRCTLLLPERQESVCTVCGQGDGVAEENRENDADETKADIDSRVKELEEMLGAQASQLRLLSRRREGLVQKKTELDRSLAYALRQYDSAYLAEALEFERRHASLDQQAVYLRKLRSLPERVDQLETSADQIATDISATLRDLKEARTAAEKDLTRLGKLASLFLDCLLRSKLAGFETGDLVQMTPPWFLPEVVGGQSGELATTSFSTLGSGGKKNLFKCCFALAVHRLVAEEDTFLPTFLIIDSPMKNISERENRAQFEGFHQLLYELATTELRHTQFILIDKEFCPPPVQLQIDLFSRHMRVASETEPPLISKYRGK